MAYQRIYENIYSFTVNAGVLNTGYKYYFDPCPEINNRGIKGISASNFADNMFNGTPALGLLYSFYITLKDKENNILCYNMPLVDLIDANAKNINYQNLRLRLFNYKNLDLKNSYYFFQSIPLLAFPPTNNLFSLNFYLD